MAALLVRAFQQAPLARKAPKPHTLRLGECRGQATSMRGALLMQDWARAQYFPHRASNLLCTLSRIPFQSMPSANPPLTQTLADGRDIMRMNAGCWRRCLKLAALGSLKRIGRAQTSRQGKTPQVVNFSPFSEDWWGIFARQGQSATRAGQQSTTCFSTPSQVRAALMWLDVS